MSNKIDLNKLLNKIGKGIFVQHFREFGNSRISNQEMIAKLPNEFTLKSRTSRTSKSRRIFRDKLEQKALFIIAESNRKDMVEAAIEARALLAELRRHSVL